MQITLRSKEKKLEPFSFAREAREVFYAFTDKDLVFENLRLKADLDSSMRERKQVASCIQNWTVPNLFEQGENCK